MSKKGRFRLERDANRRRQTLVPRTEARDYNSYCDVGMVRLNFEYPR